MISNVLNSFFGEIHLTFSRVKRNQFFQDSILKTNQLNQPLLTEIQMVKE